MRISKLIAVMILAFFTSVKGVSQNAPAHLKYFGYAIVDCFFDDPTDNSTITNYISEVDSFSNLAQMCVYDYNSTIEARVNLMNSHCVLPIVHIQSIFYERVGSNALSGDDFDLDPNYMSQWNIFKINNLAVLDTSKIAAFYLVDEPFWNGLNFSDINTVSALIKSDFPNIPIMIIEASGGLNMLQIPTSIDWISFDNYGIFDPSTDPNYLADLALLKSKKSRTSQKIFLTVDDQWLPLYGNAGFPPDTIRFMVQNYYNLAANDTDIVGLLAYLWPGGLDDPNQMGVRNMPQSVKDKNVEIGLKIKANYSPCEITSITEGSLSNSSVKVFPNPATDEVVFEFSDNENLNYQLRLYSVFGELIYSSIISSSKTSIALNHVSSGLYFYTITSPTKTVYSGKFVKN